MSNAGAGFVWSKEHGAEGGCCTKPSISRTKYLTLSKARHWLSFCRNGCSVEDTLLVPSIPVGISDIDDPHDSAWGISSSGPRNTKACIMRRNFHGEGLRSYHASLTPTLLCPACRSAFRRITLIWKFDCYYWASIDTINSASSKRNANSFCGTSVPRPPPPLASRPPIFGQAAWKLG